MPIALPNLDDLDWKQLTDEGRLLIPAAAPDWTNHNPSDPGITVLELFAYFTEILNYRVNRVGDAHIREFLALLRGPSWRPGKDLHEDVRDTAERLGETHRAVTPEDYERLALSVNDALPSTAAERISRVKCIPLRNLSAGGSDADEEAPGHMSVVVVPDRGVEPGTGLLRAVRHVLEPARMLTTRIHVTRPQFVTFSVRLTLVARENVLPAQLREQAVAALKVFFDPRRGGVAGKGWPFGRDVYVSEVYQVLGRLVDVDYVVRSRDPDSGEDLDELLTEEPDSERLRRNEAGELEAVAIKAYELVALRVAGVDLSVASP